MMDAEADSRVDQVDVLDEDAVSGVVGERGGVGGGRCLVCLSWVGGLVEVGESWGTGDVCDMVFVFDAGEGYISKMMVMWRKDG